MKKRIFAALLIFFIVFFLWVFTKLLPDIFFNMGKTAYDQQNYKKAYSDLKVAVALSPKNRDARYYYVKTLFKFSPTIKIQKDITDIAQDKFPDTADLLAEQRVSKWRDNVIANFGDNFIENTPINGKILRWDTRKMPLLVYIGNNSNGSIPEYYKKAITDAILQWQNATSGLVSFKFTNDAQQAQIAITIDSSDGNNCKEEECKYVAAYTTPKIQNDKLQQMHIILYDLDNQNKPFSQKDFYNTVLHELGHSLGIMGHSQEEGDLMFMSKGPGFDLLTGGYKTISQSDVNTLKLLYNLNPDISNTCSAKFNSSKLIYAPIVLGSKNDINSRKITEAKNYIKAAPNIPNGYIDLAAALAEQNEFNKALETLSTAESLASNDSEKYVIYYNFAIMYNQIQDWDKALEYAQKAENLQASSDIEGLIASIYFSKGQEEKAKELYRQVVKDDPTNIINSVNLARLYLRSYNFNAAGKTLNELVKANPDAKSDPRVGIFSILMFFFK